MHTASMEEAPEGRRLPYWCDILLLYGQVH